jgi:fructosamine-3-kinase
MPDSFFEEYHKHMPKTEPVSQYELRKDLYELFHYLNHTVLFGVSEFIPISKNRLSHTAQERYASCAQRKMERLLLARL